MSYPYDDRPYDTTPAATLHRLLQLLQYMLKHYEAHAPLKRNVLPDELGATGTFLASDGAAATTGQVHYVDCGYQIMGM